MSPSSSAQPASIIRQLPLWRIDAVVLPGMQEILHVMAPHYVHAFETIFSQPRPWRFGNLFLPGASRSLGSSEAELASGSNAPLIGTLMQVTRCVRLRDGKLLVLASALTRFKVLRCVQELPYSVADVQLYEDLEQLDCFQQQALTAVMQAAPDDTPISHLMSAASAAARDSCAAAAWAWLTGYEMSVAAQQEWPGPGPREGESDMETYALVQELAEHGVAEVLPLPDGAVIGRRDLAEVAAAADAAVQQVLQAAAAQLVPTKAEPGASPQLTAAAAAPESGEAAGAATASTTLDGGEVLPIVSLNTVAERGVAFQSPELQELISSRPSSSSSFADIMTLEAAVWAQLDTLVGLAARVRGKNTLLLPYGLLQLRPPALQSHLSMAAERLWGDAVAAPAGAAAAAAAAGVGSGSSGGSSVDGLVQPPVAEVVAHAEEGSPPEAPLGGPSSGSSSSSSHTADHEAAVEQDASSSSSSSDGDAAPVSSRSSIPASQAALPSASKYAFAASDGMDVAADKLWPPLRRAAKLSWAVALACGGADLDSGEKLQALLESPSVAARLRFVLALLQKHSKVLAALSAVKDLEEGSGSR